MPQIRIKPGMPCKGVSLPHAHVTHAWRGVDEATAEHAAKVRLHASNDASPLVFEFKDDPILAAAQAAEAPKESTEAGKDDEQVEAVVTPDDEELVDEDGDETEEVEETSDDSTEDAADAEAAEDPKAEPAKSKRASRKSRRTLAAAQAAEAPKESTEAGK